jgi:hypothetical protein
MAQRPRGRNIRHITRIIHHRLQYHMQPQQIRNLLIRWRKALRQRRRKGVSSEVLQKPVMGGSEPVRHASQAVDVATRLLIVETFLPAHSLTSGGEGTGCTKCHENIQSGQSRDGATCLHAARNEFEGAGDDGLETAVGLGDEAGDGHADETSHGKATDSSTRGVYAACVQSLLLSVELSSLHAIVSGLALALSAAAFALSDADLEDMILRFL